MKQEVGTSMTISHFESAVLAALCFTLAYIFLKLAFYVVDEPKPRWRAWLLYCLFGILSLGATVKAVYLFLY